MSEALTVRVFGPDNIPIPKGCTPRQVALAERMLRFDPTRETLAEAALDAGYAPETARNQTARLTEAVGFRRASEAVAKRQMDRARGLIGTGTAALSDAPELFKQMDPPYRIKLGMEMIKLGHELGENIEQRGEGTDWRRYARRLVVLAFRRGYRCCQLGRSLPQDVVLSPPKNVVSTE